MWSRVQKFTLWLVLAVVLSSAWATGAWAADAVVAQSFTASEQYTAGTVVARDATDSQKVVPATPQTRNLLVGVVVAKDASFVSYTTTNSAAVQVATSGAVLTNVSTINGDIAIGDQLTASPIEGFAMKASGSGKVIGRALAEFTRSTNGGQVRTVNDAAGKPTQVGIGQVGMTIAVGDWSGPTGLQNAFVENLKAIGGQLSGKQVSASNAVIAAMVLAIAVLVSGIVLFSSVSASMKSLGRNPLSHRVIRRSLTQVILIVVALMIVSIVVAYIIIGR